MKALVYDIEIEKAIPPRNDADREDDIDYCDGWDDKANMGISVIGAYDYAEDRYRVFCLDNFEEFQALMQARDILVSFNGLGFDNPVLRACADMEIDDAKCYDLYDEVKRAAGVSKYTKGMGLEPCAKANFGGEKTGDGALAPVQWQRGEYGNVIDYCLADVWLTKRLFDRVVRSGVLINPLGGDALAMRRPEVAA